jgi:hypothetical protein
MKRKFLFIIIGVLILVSLLATTVLAGDVESRAVVETITGKVVNVIAIASDAVWQPPTGCYLATTEDTIALNIEIGDIYDEKTHSVTKANGFVKIYDPASKVVTEDASQVIELPIIETGIDWADIINKPITLLGYGITSIDWSTLVNKPTTLSGLGITSVDWSVLANKPTTISGYGITDAKAPVYVRVTGSNATSTSTSLVDIIGLGVVLSANSVYEFEAVLSVQSSSTAGNKYAVNYSTSGATVEGQISGTLAASTMKCERMATLNTASTAFVTVASTGGITIHGIVVTGANAGNFTVKHSKVTSGTSTIFINSFLKVTKIQ